MSYKILIPARLDSTRLPGKPLRDIAGKTLIQRVVEQAKKSSADLVCVATDSRSIIEHCNEIGVESILTKQTHKTGTDRLFEACEILRLDENEIVLNVQGDEPFIDPMDIQNLFNQLEKNNANMATLFTNLQDNEKKDPSVVKLWMNPENLVKDFSRDINHLEKTKAKKHLGIYAYRVQFLRQFINWKQSVNELKRNLEQMRVLDNNHMISARISQGEIHLGVDTSSDLAKAVEIAKKTDEHF